MHAALFFFFNDTATTEIYTLSLHDALPISGHVLGHAFRLVGVSGFEIRVQRQSRRGDHLGHVRQHGLEGQDRKSTRLNSSHANISYAVFCLKKKKPHNLTLLIGSQSLLPSM